MIIARDVDEADVVMTLRSEYRQKTPVLREAEERAMPIYVLKSNTILQMQASLTSIFALEIDPRDAAMRETEEAIDLVLRRSEPVELRPQNAYIRRLQHQMAERANLVSRSRGREPYRRVRLYPDAGPDRLALTSGRPVLRSGERTDPAASRASGRCVGDGRRSGGRSAPAGACPTRLSREARDVPPAGDLAAGREDARGRRSGRLVGAHEMDRGGERSAFDDPGDARIVAHCPRSQAWRGVVDGTRRPSQRGRRDADPAVAVVDERPPELPVGVGNVLLTTTMLKPDVRSVKGSRARS